MTNRGEIDRKYVKNIRYHKFAGSFFTKGTYFQRFYPKNYISMCPERKICFSSEDTLVEFFYFCNFENQGQKSGWTTLTLPFEVKGQVPTWKIYIHAHHHRLPKIQRVNLVIRNKLFFT